MAKQTPPLPSGRVGNVIFYTFNGIPCVRARPLRVRQTKATKASAAVFGRAVSIGSGLRQGLLDMLTVFPAKEKRAIMYRLNNAALQWLREEGPGAGSTTTALFQFEGLELNPKSELKYRLKKKPELVFEAGKIILKLPEWNLPPDIIAPSGTVSIRWNIKAAGGSILDRAFLEEIQGSTVEMTYGSQLVAPQSIELPVSYRPNKLILVVIGLQYFVERKGKKELNKELRWLPLGVLGGCLGKVI